MNRRDLIQKIVLGGTTLFVLPAYFNRCTKADNPGSTGPKEITIDLTNAKYSALNSAGGSVIVQEIIIANAGNGVFIALDSICTHLGCTITYNLASNNFPCPCHGSVYSTTGSVINGPAVIGLKSYPVSKSGNILTISV